ncbi:type VII secretion protein EccB [Streptomyces sp. NBC_01728]|uniref:type VII secretion protein EccB n=1 Tax=unclassified Streptomyces TaxID=2593676 RepID=UPI00224D8CF4|nr:MULTISPECIES: type VII secretion protein EccB [unclassified Streptomyces]MCX4460793.1 type VII secretion protein EccB [Streptomyces sp. NBC_01719]MCX4499877.1 type VII secretion protein EccB [Streptomyces sp. NBC_01728]
MQTRRDHVQAYQFAMGRLASALVNGDPGRGESPTRRSTLGSVFGVGLVVLLCAGFAVYGLISPVAKDDWRKDGAVVLEKDTGNRYIYADGVLRPTRNYASALLIAGKRAAPETPSAKSLAGVPHGAPVGIPGAPDSVPDASSLTPGPWARCLPGTGNTGAGQSLAFGSVASAMHPLPAGRQVLVSGPKGARYLLLRGVKHPVPDHAALIALGLDDQAAFTATADWLAAVPTGETLAAPLPQGAGKPAGEVAGHPARVGQLFRTSTGGTERHYLLRSDGLVPVNPTAYALLAARPNAPEPRQVEQTDIAVAPVSADRAATDRIPDVIGVPALQGGTVCLEQLPGGKYELTVGHPDGRRVLLPAGGGVLAVLDGSRLQYLITEQGVKYRIADDGAVQALGLGGTKNRLSLPAGVLALLPDGPVLSRTAAGKG